jgi:hypothetical protein
VIDTVSLASGVPGQQSKAAFDADPVIFAEIFARSILYFDVFSQ